MKIALLSGAYKNSGDFLIEHRMKTLLNHVYPDAEIKTVLRNQIANHIDEINSCDVAVFGGGPIYMPDLKGYLPLTTCMEQIKCPVSIVGGGWFGAGDGNNQIYQYRFDRETIKFFNEISQKGVLTVRDLLTYEVLKANGLNVYMTGCPAWYDIPLIDQTELRTDGEPYNIIVSDPAYKFNNQMCVDVIRFVKEKYCNANIILAFHRGVNNAEKSVLEAAAKLGIRTVDLSGNWESFHIYDDCDMHIGFRVHAHIYNLSKRNKSILIEEDGRGAGVNKALGFPGIKAYSDIFHSGNPLFQKVYKRLPVYTNPNVIDQLDSYIEVLSTTNNLYYTNAFRLEKMYFGKMMEAIGRIHR